MWLITLNWIMSSDSVFSSSYSSWLLNFIFSFIAGTFDSTMSSLFLPFFDWTSLACVVETLVLDLVKGATIFYCFFLFSFFDFFTFFSYAFLFFPIFLGNFSASSLSPESLSQPCPCVSYKGHWPSSCSLFPSPNFSFS